MLLLLKSVFSFFKLFLEKSNSIPSTSKLLFTKLFFLFLSLFILLISFLSVLLSFKFLLNISICFWISFGLLLKILKLDNKFILSLLLILSILILSIWVYLNIL